MPPAPALEQLEQLDTNAPAPSARFGASRTAAEDVECGPSCHYCAGPETD
ncbi:hypothetical protein GCM10023081_02300 [Arthrobacter ginkgonis]|uniref:Uncharacterized protein n=1 Tax=Arthrobacter ginkgonis TaxID=1630594 RepID=A0ABP7BR32_9MICC